MGENNKPKPSEQMTSEEWKLFVSKRHAGRYKQGNANELTKSIITWLRWNGYSAWRNNTMGVFDSTLAIKLILDLIKSCISIRKIPNKNEVSAVIKRCYRKSHERVGASDVIGFHKKTGHFIAVEVKHGKDRLRPEQEAFLNEVRKANGIGIEARSMEGFLSEFESQKKILFSLQLKSMSMIAKILKALSLNKENLESTVKAQRKRIAILSQVLAILKSEQNSCKNED